MSKSTKKSAKKPTKKSTSRQKPGPDTPVPVPLGTIHAMSEFISQATGPCQLAMQIIQSLQLAADNAGVGRQGMQHTAETQKK